MTESATTGRWRPRLLWIPMGALMGAVCGAGVGAALLVGYVLVDPGNVPGAPFSELGFAVVAGMWFGGFAGVAVGLAVGAVMTVLVGAHLPREVARRRARRLGHLLPPVAMLAPFVVTGELSLSAVGSEAVPWLFVLLAAGGLGGPLARWIAGLPPVVPVT